MDTPVTLARLSENEVIPYLPPEGLSEFDLVLSYTGGVALELLRRRLAARRVAALYGWVDPDYYFRVTPSPEFEADFSYLGTYSGDRQSKVEDFLLEPARQLSEQKFLIAGAMYPNTGTWPANVRHYEHIAPPQHTGFYSSSPLTLSVTRQTMAVMGFCPSGRLFEASACGTAVLSDYWEGLESFFSPGEEILTTESCAGVVEERIRGRGELRTVGLRARQGTLDCHTAAIRSARFIRLLEDPELISEADQMTLVAKES